MGWRMTSLLAGATLTGATGCVAPYGAALSCRPGTDGYCQRELAPGRYALTYAGTPEDPAEPLAAQWLARAAQLCGTRGHDARFTHGPAFDVHYRPPALTGVAPDLALADAGPAVYGEVVCTDTPVAVASAAAADPGPPDAGGEITRAPAPVLAMAASQDASATPHMPTPFTPGAGEEAAASSSTAPSAVPPAPTGADGIGPSGFVALAGRAQAPDSVTWAKTTEAADTPYAQTTPIVPVIAAPAPVQMAGAGSPALRVADSAALPPSARGYVFGPLVAVPAGAIGSIGGGDPNFPTHLALTDTSPPATAPAMPATAPAPFTAVQGSAPAMDDPRVALASRSAQPDPFTQAMPAETLAPVARAGTPVAAPDDLPDPSAYTLAPPVPQAFGPAARRTGVVAPAQTDPATVPVAGFAAEPAPPATLARGRVPETPNLPPAARGYVFGALDTSAPAPAGTPQPVSAVPRPFRARAASPWADALVPVNAQGPGGGSVSGPGTASDPAGSPAAPGVPGGFRPI